MKQLTTFAVATTLLAAMSAVQAGTEPYFNPLTQSTAVASPQHVNELNSPWQTPAGLSQDNLMSMAEVEQSVNGSIQRVDAGTSSSMFDMIAYDPTGRFLFIPHETPFGAGVSRYNASNDNTHLIFAGDQGAAAEAGCVVDDEADDPLSGCPDWDDDFAAFDPARWTPNNTLFLAEEWSGLGRVVEIMKPLSPPPADPTSTALVEGVDYRVLESIAKVSHEGINFSEKYENRVIYYIDEWNSGSIYALVLKNKGDYAGGGKTFVLSVDNFAPTGGDPTANWDEGPNATAERFGLATWVPITNWDGEPLPGITNPFRDGPTSDPREDETTRGGRPAADDVGGTPYGRPEDMEVGLLPNGNEVLYITVTSENSIISIEILDGMKSMVRQFATPETPTNLGFPATTGVINSPDNLAQDALGNIYVIEDAPNSADVGGDVWFVRDTDSDGVAESLDHFMSIQVNGSESTGMIFNPADPTRFVVAVQHPTSVDPALVEGGFGDAVWEFDLSTIVPPTCADSVDPASGKPSRASAEVYSWHTDSWVKTCSDDGDFTFVDGLEKAGKPKQRVQGATFW